MHCKYCNKSIRRVRILNLVKKSTSTSTNPLSESIIILHLRNDALTAGVYSICNVVADLSRLDKHNLQFNARIEISSFIKQEIVQNNVNLIISELFLNRKTGTLFVYVSYHCT